MLRCGKKTPICLTRPLPLGPPDHRSKIEFMTLPSSWHAARHDLVLEQLGAKLHGLSTDEADRRRARHGPNELPPPRVRAPFLRFLDQFHNVLIYVLIAAGAITAALGHAIDSAVIFGVVLINAAIGFVQEGKAESALNSIRRMLSPQALTLRDGHRIPIAARDLVPGDIVFLSSGDKVPADLRLVQTKGLRLQEAALTGESLAVDKGIVPVSADTPLAERSCMAYAGTLVGAGVGAGVVAATGAATEIGHISAMLTQIRPLTTPLMRQMAVFGRVLTFAILAIAAGTFVFGVTLRDYGADEMFLAAVGLSVAAIPEGLPAIMTIALAVGVERMARRNAIIRRLPAVETLGAVSIICSDKTGTLTRNEMAVMGVAAGQNVFEVTGSGYSPEGEIRLAGRPADAGRDPLLHALARGAFLCSDASLRHADGDWTVDGDPMEGALIAFARKAGIDPEAENAAWARMDVIPFDAEHRFMATLHRNIEGTMLIHVKGAPERILEMCGRQCTETGEAPLDQAYWQREITDTARRGQRVLALAVLATRPDHTELKFSDVASGLTLLGLFGLADPPRAESIEAVARCQSAGIRVKMITGDHAGTATAIAQQLGLARPEAVLTGRQIDALDDPELRARIGDVDVFARASPAHKLRLVQALQAGRHIVAMTGDGVNDAPALKRANVGVAMGQKGTEAAKDAAEMVLADDNFASIAHAVEEGRTVYDNLKKAITFILPTNGGEALMIVAAIALGHALPITPVQILWVNMITAVTLALALAFEPAEHDVMARPPRPPAEPILSHFLIWRIAFVSTIMLAGTFGLFLWEINHGAEVAAARTVAVNALVMFEIFYAVSTRYLGANTFTWQGLFGSRQLLLAAGLVIALQIAFTYAGFMQVLFDTRPLPLAAWIRLVAISSSVYVLVELEKWAIRRWRDYRNTTLG